MTQVHISNEIDTAVLAVEQGAVDTDEHRAEFLNYVRGDLLRKVTADSASEAFQPFFVEITNIEASYCRTAEEIDAFQGKHECSECSGVQPAAHTSLAEYPDAVIVLMNIYLRKFFVNPLTI